MTKTAAALGERAPDSEKITINLGYVDLGHVDLLVTEGRMRVQTSGETSRDVDAGGAVVIAPGEKHWHGAAPGMRAVQLAVNVNATTDWLEPVTDEDYNS